MIDDLLGCVKRQKEKATVRQYCDLCIANNQNRYERLGNLKNSLMILPENRISVKRQAKKKPHS